MSRASKVLLGGILAVGLALRFLGLSHDLWEGYVYHPDSAKQMRAVQMFLRGVYFIHIGNSDWDGYPYLFPHLVEYACRLYQLVAHSALRLLGVQYPIGLPQYLSLYWIARVANALLSGATILVAARIGTRAFTPAAGLAAALFVALSPIDVVACHYEGGDTSAAFFSALALLFALRVYDRGRAVDYALGTFWATCALAAKYHAGMSLVPMLVAHALRARSRDGLWSSRSLQRILLIGVTGLVSLPLTIPSLFTHPVEQLADILAFFRHLDESTRMRVPEIAALGKLARVAHALRHHLPILAGLVSLPLAALLLASPVVLRAAGARFAIVLSMPLVYFVVGISFRPAAHPVYHTLVTPLAFVIAAAALVALAPASWRARPMRAAALVLLLASAVIALGRSTLREDYFFYHSDTRRLADEWESENVPASFRFRSRGYSFARENRSDPADVDLPGSVVVSSSLRHTRTEAGALLLKRFDLEPAPSLPIFRNPVLDLLVETPILHEGFEVPPVPRLPSEVTNDLVFLGGSEFYRSARRMRVDRAFPVSRTLVSEHALDGVLVLAQNGAEPATLSLSIGGRRRALLLGAWQSAWIELAELRPSFPSRPGHLLYPVKAATSSGQARVTLATTDLEKAVGLYEQGAFADSRPWLEKAAAETRDPAIAAMAAITARLGGAEAVSPGIGAPEELADSLLGPLGAERLNQIYGGVPRYLEALDYLTFEAETVPGAGLDAVPDPQASGRSAGIGRPSAERQPRISVELPMLDPGHYVLSVRARATSREARDLPIRIELSDGNGRSYETAGRLSDLEPQEYVERRFPVHLPYFAPAWRLTLSLDAKDPVSMDTLAVAPDLPSNLASLARLLRLSRGEVQALPPEDPASTDADRLMAELAASRKQAPREPCEVVFDGGVRLTGTRIEEPSVAPGEALHVDLGWTTTDVTRNLEEATVFLHFLDDRGKVTFQSDLRLVDFLDVRPGDAAPRTRLQAVRVPANVPPGSYRVHMGVYLPSGRLEPLSSDLPIEKSGVLLSKQIVVGG